jgi:hypothetical protein
MARGKQVSRPSPSTAPSSSTPLPAGCSHLYRQFTVSGPPPKLTETPGRDPVVWVNRLNAYLAHEFSPDMEPWWRRSTSSFVFKGKEIGMRRLQQKTEYLRYQVDGLL